MSRETTFPVHPQFVERWSNKAFAERPVDPDRVCALFEAARWAPSSSNGQPWLFLYADQEPGLTKLRALLNEGNRVWADRAPVLAFLAARRRFAYKDRPNRHYAFDTGAAWMSLALQAHDLGLSCRAMAGFHHDESYDVLGLDRDEYEVMCAIAIGWPADPGSVREDKRYTTPSDRRALDEVARKI